MEAGDPIAVAWTRRTRDPTGTLEEAERLRDEAMERGDDLARARALTLAGSCHTIRNDHPAAFRALLEALPLLEGAPDEERARALSELGYLEAAAGDAPAGLERLRASLRISERLGDRVACASAWNRIGVVFFGRQELDLAEDAYERSLALLPPDGDGPHGALRAGVRNNLAKVATARGDLERALTELAAAARAFEATGDGHGAAMVVHNTAVVLAEQGERLLAIQLLHESIEGYEAVGWRYGACEARTRLGRLLAADDPVQALALVDRAHGDAEALGLADECVRAADALADLSEAQGDLEAAVSWLRHLRAAERRLFDEASDHRLRTLQARFQLEQLERDTVTDPLTGLVNRRGLDRALREAIAVARTDGGALALVLLDLDDFKAINDRFSHSIGDEALCRVAQVLRERTRPSDVCARFGGEEFVVLLPGCGEEQAARVAEDLRRAVRDHDWGSVAAGLAVTTSAGVAELGLVGDPRSLLDSADRSLYGAKHAGKDRVGRDR